MTSQTLGFRKIYRHLDKILILFFILYMFMEELWIPTNSTAAEFLLSLTGAGYLSYNNIGQVLLSNPLVTAGFILLLFLNLVIAYLQMGAFFLGIKNLLEDKEASLTGYLKHTFNDVLGLWRDFHISKVFYLLFYVGILFPFIKRILRIYYLNKILIPDFIITYLQQNVWFAFLFGIFSLVMIWLAIRLMFSLPQIFFKQMAVRDAVRISWEKTRKKTLSYAWRLAWVSIKSLVFFFTVVVLDLMMQTLADSLDDQLSYFFAIGNYTLLRFAYYIAISYFLLKFVMLVSEKELPLYSKKRRDYLLRFIIVFVSIGSFIGEGVFYLSFPADIEPLVISHRGVSEQNGVQNTIEALEKTSQLKPDYVEMDVQETKDHQFVVMHDANLQALAGVDAKPQELTLEELTSLDVTENGYTAKIPSFDAYLEKANQLGQKLLVEIKVSNLDSPDMMKRFMEKYGSTLKKEGHQMHSLDYKVVESVKNYSKRIPIFFILPYNTIFPQTVATGYTMEYSTLDENFMFKLFMHRKEVYDWTVNDDSSIQKSLHLGVDGIITDDVQLVRESVTDLETDQNYTTILLDQVWSLTNPT